MPAALNPTPTLVAELPTYEVVHSTVFAPLAPTPVFSAFWAFAAERQAIFWRRLQKPTPPWTTDPILATYKFTNAYRASDRVSQYLIHKVIDEGDQRADEIIFRVLLFKLFNKIETWQLLVEILGPLSWEEFRFERYDRVLTAALESGERIYSAAYIMPAGSQKLRFPRKHRAHLELLQHMMNDDLPGRLAACKSLKAVYELLRSYPLLGSFLAYQYAIDLNYSTAIDFDESEFVVAGPGARSGIQKCFRNRGTRCDADIIAFVAESQAAEFESRGINFQWLGGRKLQWIDIQNLFCEIDKYARVRFPENNASGRTRIKQHFNASAQPIQYWYPPKWGINAKVQEQIQAASPSSQRADVQLSRLQVKS